MNYHIDKFEYVLFIKWFKRILKFVWGLTRLRTKRPDDVSLFPHFCHRLGECIDWSSDKRVLKGAFPTLSIQGVKKTRSEKKKLRLHNLFSRRTFVPGSSTIVGGHSPNSNEAIVHARSRKIPFCESFGKIWSFDFHNVQIGSRSLGRRGSLVVCAFCLPRVFVKNGPLLTVRWLVTGEEVLPVNPGELYRSFIIQKKNSKLRLAGMPQQMVYFPHPRWH